MQHESHLPRPIRRPRRMRHTPIARAMQRETRLSPEQLVLPLFILDGQNRREPIASLPGQARLSVDNAVGVIEQACEVGVRSFAIFPAVDPKLKSREATEAINPENLCCAAVRKLKAAAGDVCIITDIALDPYSSVGHDGLVSDEGVVLNDETVEMLAQMAVLHAEAGADFVAPSDMMDGRVAAIRAALDDADQIDTGIIAYTAKYASAFYGPFRDALESAPVDAPNIPRDKQTYQMDPANSREAELEAQLDIDEGADMIMVKPALPYLDIVRRLREMSPVPIAAYHVSGEYAMIKAAAEKGWLDEKACMAEALMGIARAGADVIFTYAAIDCARWLREGA